MAKVEENSGFSYNIVKGGKPENKRLEVGLTAGIER